MNRDRYSSNKKKKLYYYSNNTTKNNGEKMMVEKVFDVSGEEGCRTVVEWDCVD